jgi:hypothetical protein
MQPSQYSVAGSMNDIVERAFRAYEHVHEIDAVQLAVSRDRISQYVDTLMSAGQRDPHQLTEFACAYLKELHQGPDPRYSGC